MASVESLRPLPPPSPDEPPRLTARTLGGLEEVLAAELLRLGAGDLRIGRRTIEFSGSTETLYRAVLARQQDERTQVRQHADRERVGVARDGGGARASTR